ncbi:MAG TPA: MXAN_2562 family outer membrane beta-barrel protein [Labilithrix sp.]|nr:MXAN_2562 family outer membrane beta-barrel protein [Labilithrix sp.]
MHRSLLLCSLVSATALFARNASAIELGTPAQAHPFRSAQHFALELRFSPYYPAVDDEPGLQGTPFQQRFGTSPRLYVGLEFDWQTFRIPYIGTIGPGIGVGTVSMSRPSVTVTGRASGDEYGLTIYPMYLAAVLRVDTFWRGAGFPLVPYGKLGAGLGLWDASSGGETARSSDGVKGSGATWGTHAAVGISFPLDVLDRGASRNMDNATGINNTYLYAEYYWLGLNGLGQDKALYVGTNTWAAGLAFEF